MSNPMFSKVGRGTDRRTFVRGMVAAAALPFLSPLGAGRVAGAEPESPTHPADAPAFPGLISREEEPQNLEFPFPTLDSFLTPNPRFYVRNHFAAPKLEARDWRLKVEGAVEHPLELTYDELLKMAPRTQTALLECAGNGRVFLTPKASGVAWELGAASNAEWAGVPLASVLDKAGVRGAAVEVILEGADAGEIKDEPKSPGKISFARSLPLEKARKPEVLLAHKMNGEDLPAAHGFPVRALVPGWYGMASVKWLTRIVVTDRPFQGYFQSLSYTSFERVNGLPSMVPVTELEVKAEVARPMRGEVVQAGFRLPGPRRGLDRRVGGGEGGGQHRRRQDVDGGPAAGGGVAVRLAAVGARLAGAGEGPHHPDGSRHGQEGANPAGEARPRPEGLSHQPYPAGRSRGALRPAGAIRSRIYYRGRTIGDGRMHHAFGSRSRRSAVRRSDAPGGAAGRRPRLHRADVVRLVARRAAQPTRQGADGFGRAAPASSFTITAARRTWTSGT